MITTPHSHLFGRLALITLLGGLIMPTAGAETAYVIDRLQAGIHKGVGPDSTILGLLGTGSAVEITQRNNGYVRVRAKDGTEGWMDSAYLTTERPGAADMDGLKQQKLTLEQDLRKTKLELLRVNEELEDALARPTVKVVSKDDGALDQAHNRITRLQEENARLQENLAQAETRSGEMPEPSTQPEPARVANAEAPALNPWYVLAIVFGLLLSGAIGSWLTDFMQRRRHGGFRV